ncbi:MAG: phospho-N-acetylmuramoyl-pentapeptide-transferase [Candidatus Glassbacteria bacterium]
MFYHLLFPLAKYHIIFNVFRYITFRAAYATITALIISFILGPWLIRMLRRKKMIEIIDADLPARHMEKKGTPTMGGIFILIAVIVPTLLWADLTDRYVHLVLFSTLWMGAIGMLDDYLKIVKRRSKGLIGRYKLAGQIMLGLILGFILKNYPLHDGFVTLTSIPFVKSLFIDLGIFYIPFIILVIVGTSNAVNLTDGLDGLAIGVSAFACFSFAGFSYLHGHAQFSRYLQILSLPGSGELTIFCMSLVGASLGFLWFNAHPAQVFMGDTGSLAIGGALATLSILLKAELLLFIVGGVFVIEALSVLIQVFMFRWKGKRVFRMAPIHHHFELCGWSESKVVVRFFIVAGLFALIAFSTLKIR